MRDQDVRLPPLDLDVMREIVLSSDVSQLPYCLPKNDEHQTCRLNDGHLLHLRETQAFQVEFNHGAAHGYEVWLAHKESCRHPGVQHN